MTGSGTSNPSKGLHPGPGVRVLVIDDDPTARAAVREVLAADFATTTIEEITDHVGFFRALQGRGFDVVLTERVLHWSTGNEVLAAVKAVHPMIPVVMTVAQDDRDAAAQALRAGLDAWVVKGPDFRDRLRASLRTALQLVEYSDRVTSLEERQHALLDRLNVGVFRATLDGRLVEANPAFLRLVGVGSWDEAEGRDLDELLGREGCRLELLEQIGQGGMAHDVHLPVDRTGGWVALTVTCESAAAGDLVLEGLVEDISERQRALETQHLAGEQYRAIFESTSAATVIVDDDGTVTLVNAAFAALTGYHREEVEGQKAWSEFIARQDRQRVVGLTEEESGPWTVEFHLVDRAGSVLETRATVALLPGTRRTVWSLLDLTRRRQVEAQLLHEAYHDALTGLPNRHNLLDRLDELYESGDPAAALIVLDLDRFKVVNDGLGHRVGDRLLKAVGGRLTRTVAEDRVVCLGGDAFAVLVAPVTGAHDALRTAAEVQLELGRPFTFEGRQIFTSASLGLAHAADAAGAEELLRNAEAAMNRAKATGRNRWVLFETEMVERAARAFAVENDLRRAFSADEFRVLFQPVVTIPERAVAGFEALVRWQHPVEGLLGPDRFLAVADDAGLMIPLGRWVLHDACRSLREWPVDRSLHVSVNLTLRQLLHRELVDDISRLLDQLMLPHSSLVLELGEGLLLADPEATAETLGRLAELGVRLCIDDFGSGWASLGLLHRVRFHLVKLDRSLLAGIGDDSERWRIVEQLHALAGHLGLEIVAQGIEDDVQLSRLQAIGFTLGQSHLLGAPMESAAAARFAGG